MSDVWDANDLRRCGRWLYELTAPPGSSLAWAEILDRGLWLHRAQKILDMALRATKEARLGYAAIGSAERLSDADCVRAALGTMEMLG